MNNALTAIIVAIGGASVGCLLVSRTQGRQHHLRRSHDGSGSDGGYYAGDDIGGLFGSTGTHHSPSDSAAPGHSAGSHDAGSSGDRAQAIVGEAAAMEEEAATAVAAEATSGLRHLQGPELPRDYSRSI